MLLFKMTCLALSATCGTTSSAIVPADSGADSVLTTELLGRMTTLWTSFAKEPASVRDTGRKANQIPFTIPLTGGIAGSQPDMQLPGVVNMAAMATKFPSVATDFKQAGLTPQQWEQARKALFAAMCIDELDKYNQQRGMKPAPANSSVLWQNITFLRTHQKEVDELKASGMWFPKPEFTTAGGNGQSLNP